MMLLSLDPGQSDCGVALFLDGELSAAGWVKSPLKLKNDPRGWGAMAGMVCGWVSANAPWLGVKRVAFERMQPRRSDDPAKTFTIMGLLAVSAWVCALFPDAEHAGYFPSQWRGTVAGKESYCRRVRERLSEEEMSRIILPAKRFQHNVYAAVGVGLKDLGRFELERVYSSS